MKIKMIVAMDEYGLIGNGDKLPWRIPSELKHFKETTTGHTVIMGRKTFESLGKRPLPNRRNIVLTSDVTYSCSGAEVAHGVADALSLCSVDDEVFIMGGKEVYKAFYDHAEELVATHIDAEYEGDVYLDFVDWEEDWKLNEETTIKEEGYPAWTKSTYTKSKKAQTAI